jgi:hypothetical protein
VLRLGSATHPDATRPSTAPPPPRYPLQKITIEEFLPALLGHRLGSYTGYNDTVNPGVSIEFATVGFRQGVTLATPAVKFLDDRAATVFSVRRAPLTQTVLC